MNFFGAAKKIDPKVFEEKEIKRDRACNALQCALEEMELALDELNHQEIKIKKNEKDHVKS